MRETIHSEIEELATTGSMGISGQVRKMLVSLGEDPDRDGLLRTPLRFEKANRSSGQNLINTVWGQEVLSDFRLSKLMETISTRGTTRWYQGKIYNYETWHHTNNTIVHFGVVSKEADQGTRIKEYIRCAKDTRACGP